MRQITHKVNDAFAYNKSFKGGNDKVIVEGTNVKMILYNTIIAEKINGKIFICNGGYTTNTTKDRLNGITGVSIQQKQGKWYLNGEYWDGTRKQIN